MYGPSRRFIEEPDSLHHKQLLHWRFDRTDAGVAKDSSGNGYDGTNNGATIDQPGKIKRAYSFGGSDSVDAAQAGLLSALAGSSNFAMSIWAAGNSFESYDAALSIADTGTNEAVTIFPFHNPGGMGGDDGVLVWFNNEEIIVYEGGSLPDANGVFNQYGFQSNSATDHDLIINGVIVASSTANKTIDADIDIVTAGSYDSAAEFITADLDDARIWDRNLTQAEWTRLALGQ